jgi:hypothetical protein
MSIEDPFLFAGEAQIKQYLENKVKHYADLKGSDVGQFENWLEKMFTDWDSEAPSNLDNAVNPKNGDIDDTLPPSDKDNTIGNPNSDDKDDTPEGFTLRVEKKENALTEKEKNAIQAVALLEWNQIMMVKRTAHRQKVKSQDRKKSDKKENEMENARFLAKLEAQARARNKQKK